MPYWRMETRGQDRDRVFPLGLGRQTRSRTLGAVGQPHDLPAAISSFVGRVEELDALAGLVRAGRIVTILGTGGCGKTRLAVEFARGRLDQFDLVYFIDLSVIHRNSDVLRRLADTMGIESEDATLLSRVAAEIGR